MTPPPAHSPLPFDYVLYDGQFWATAEFLTSADGICAWEQIRAMEMGYIDYPRVLLREARRGDQKP